MRSLWLAAVPALASLPAWSHSHLPLNQGSVTTYAYRFQVKGEKAPKSVPETRGKIRTKNTGLTTVEGRSYWKFVTSYEGIFGIKDEPVSYRREDDGNVYLAYYLRGKWIETLELPREVAVGREWDYDDGEKSRRRITGLLDLEFAGRKYHGCIEVTRTVLKNERLKSALNRNYYCPGVGEVRSVFSQPSPLGDYVTETSLIEHRAGAPE
jgi:hypothetical protein